MLTFGFGSGLAGLAGAFLSQLGNVGPGMGQERIVDAFMTVVVGGVGSIAGTVISALGIGVVDQSLQQILLNPVLGKILVLLAIILFLQWRPAGLFVTRSRSLDRFVCYSIPGAYRGPRPPPPPWPRRSRICGSSSARSTASCTAREVSSRNSGTGDPLPGR